MRYCANQADHYDLDQYDLWGIKVVKANFCKHTILNLTIVSVKYFSTNVKYAAG